MKTTAGLNFVNIKKIQKKRISEITVLWCRI